MTFSRWSKVMNDQIERHDDEDPIELGSVSGDTKGTNFVIEDTEGGRSLPMGLTDD